MADTFKSEGIILRTIKYSESSIIVDIYTKVKGLRSFIVSGLNSKKNKSKSSCFRHLNIVNIVAYDKTNGSLARIKEFGISYYYKSLTYDVTKSSIGLFAIEVCRSSIKELEPNESLYDYIYETLIKLDTVEHNLALEPIYFTLGLMSHIGITPDNNWSNKNIYFDVLNGRFDCTLNEYSELEEISKLISQLLSSSRDKVSIKKLYRDKILDIILKYYQIHIDGFKSLKSVDVLREIF